MIGPLAYIGGKRRVAPRIIKLIAPHTAYVEPFAGGAQVFFHKPRSRVEVLNDLDGEVHNFLRICQHHSAELARTLKYWVSSRRWHELLVSQDPATLTDVQRAARFLYLQRTSFGGRRRGQAFRYGVTKPSSFNATRVAAILDAAADRLAGVQLECWPYEKVLERYDRPTTFFYCDPPYVGLSLYRLNFGDDDFGLLAERLAKLRGKFLLSINDCPLARQMFGRFELRELAFSYSANRSAPVGRELLISNYPLPETI